MTDRNETTGQFSDAEPLVGERAAEAAAGYIPHEEAPIEKGPEETGELAEMFAEARGHEPEPEPDVDLSQFEDPDSPKQAYSQDQLVDEISGRRFMHELNVERVGNAEVAAFADNIREALGPELGLKPEQKTEPAKAETPTPEVTAMMESGVERDVAEALAKPQVRAAVEAQISEANQVREQYSAGLENARLHTLATLAEVVPHLAGLPPAQFEQGLAVLAEVDPPAFQKAMNVLGRAHTIAQAQQQIQQQQAYVQHQQFETTVAAEDARLTEMFDGDKAAADAATDATISYLSEHGFTRRQMVDVFRANPVLTTAEGRRTIWEAAKYRDIQKAKVTASARPVPPVQRPGIAASAAERHASSVDAKTARARGRIDSGNGDAKDIASILRSLRA